VEALVALANESAGCSQFVRWECKGSAWSDSDGTVYTFWKNRRGEQRQYWGGSAADLGGCACSVDNSCAKPSTKCNCDANDNVMRADKGDLNVAEDLPIAVFFAGDTGGCRPKERVVTGSIFSRQSHDGTEP
jgi:hypothetical protein